MMVFSSYRPHELYRRLKTNLDLVAHAKTIVTLYPSLDAGNSGQAIVAIMLLTISRATSV